MMASNVSRDVSQDQSSVVQTCKPWYAFATVAAGRFVRFASRVTKHGGSALPGKVVEKIDPGFLTRTLGQLPLGVVLVSGTNGKTTTTRMVASMLSDLGLKVFTNPTGSNFVRGVVSALLTEVTLGGKLDADIAVLELDEAYAVHFVKQVKPRYALLLNVMRDQLDRFGEIDTTAKLLSHVAAATTGTVVLNREDPRIAALAAKAPAGTTVRYFGLADDLRHYFPSDDDMATTVSVEGVAGPLPSARTPLSPRSELRGASTGTAELPADVTLTAVGDHKATFQMDGQGYATDVKLEGVYNLYNAAAALAVVRAVMQDNAAASKATAAANACAVSADELIAAVSRVTPAFGRGEVIDVNGSPVELLLVKNPMGFRLSLASFDPANADTIDRHQRRICRRPRHELAVGRGLHFPARVRCRHGLRRACLGHGIAPGVRPSASRRYEHRPRTGRHRIRQRQSRHTQAHLLHLHRHAQNPRRTGPHHRSTGRGRGQVTIL